MGGGRPSQTTHHSSRNTNDLLTNAEFISLNVNADRKDLIIILYLKNLINRF